MTTLLTTTSVTRPHRAQRRGALTRITRPDGTGYFVPEYTAQCAWERGELTLRETPRGSDNWVYAETSTGRGGAGQ